MDRVTGAFGPWNVGFIGEQIMSDEVSEASGAMLDATSFGVPLLEIATTVNRQRFNRLAETWKKETGHLSKVTKRSAHPAYQEIIAMGAGVVPLILYDLKKTRDDWFWALSAITGENPITEADAGNVPMMTEAWLRWGRANGYDV